MMTAKKKAELMVHRWSGNKAVCIQVAKDNLFLKYQNNDLAGVMFWEKVLSALGWPANER